MKLFIHGVPDTGYMWTPLVAALGLSEDEARTPTMPGFDGTLPPGFPATAEAYVGWVVQTLEQVAADAGPVDIVGHDWGAPMTAMAAHLRPDLIRSWTVINAAPEPTFKWHKLARTWQTPILGELFMALGSSTKFRQQLIAAGMPKDIAKHEAPRINGAMKRSILKLYRSAKDPAEWTTDFSSIAGKGLVLWGEKDPFVPVSVAQRFSARWAIPLKVVEATGHWGLCEKPEDFAEHLATHWAGDHG